MSNPVIEQQKIAKIRAEMGEKILVLANQLYREKGVIATLFDRSLVSASVAQIGKLHQRAKQIAGQTNGSVCLHNVYYALQTIGEKDVKNSQVDVGRIVANLPKQAEQSVVAPAVESVIANAGTGNDKTVDVVLYGFGRIGRILTRLILEQTGLGRGLNLKAIVVRKTQDGDLAKRVSLLERDSVHGTFAGAIEVDEENEAIIANGHYIKVIYANDPSEIDYTQYGIDNALVIDNTGKWRDADGLSKHLKSKGVAKALLTAPSKGEMKNVVFGVNDSDILPEDTIISAASCTTNAITPTLKVLNDKYGISSGHVETIHSYTNDQNLIDNYHKADRRGRSASLNMVITETGAAKAVAKALPALKGKLTGNSIRVPTPNVSLAILNITFDNAPANVDEINELMKQTAQSTQWSDQIDFTDSPDAVSTDYVSAKEVSIFDALATIVSGNQAHLYLWYDNEMGYSCQVLRIAQKMAGIETAKIG